MATAGGMDACKLHSLLIIPENRESRNKFRGEADVRAKVEEGGVSHLIRSSCSLSMHGWLSCSSHILFLPSSTSGSSEQPVRGPSVGEQ